jgi:DNA polymerase I-like protein with 3'-5' exonuclease and polymerase domains
MHSTEQGNGRPPGTAREAAAYYRDRGWTPIPVPHGLKKPVLPEWGKVRADTADLDALFPPGQRLNLGLLLGRPSAGLVDVDCDCPEAVAAAPILLPPTALLSGRTSVPKSHYWFRVGDPPDKAYEAFDDVVEVPGDDHGCRLLELRSTGGQTIVAPSKHPDEGEYYCWNSFGEPAFLGLPELTVAVRSLAAASLIARHWKRGNRNDAAKALAGGLLRAGWATERVETFLQAVAVAAGDEQLMARLRTVSQTEAKLEKDKKTTGWPSLMKELGQYGEAVVGRVCEWLGCRKQPGAKKQVRVLEPYRPFPVEALPDPVREFVRQGALALGCDPAYLALPALAVAASVVGNTRSLRLKGGWDEPCIVWSAIVGDSGTLKSPAYLKAVGHLFRLQRQRLQEFKQLRKKYQEEMREYKKKKQEAEEKGNKHPGDAPEEPVLQRVVCSDTTVEKLAEILTDNPRGLLVARDELAGWLGSFTRYKAQRGATDLPNWLEMFRAGTVIVDRKTGQRPTLFIHRAAVSVTGGIQPGVLARALTPEFLDAGLAARILMAMPPKLPKRWSEVEVDQVVEAAYHDALDKLLDLDFHDHDGEKAPHLLRLSPEGKAAWVGFYDRWAAEQASVEGELAAAFSKLEAYAARFALLHHVIGRAGRGEDDLVPVGAESVKAGVALCRWFAAEARRIYATLTESNEERDARRLVEFIRARGGSITAKRLQQSNSRKYPSAEAATAALDALAEAGYGGWMDRPSEAQGGRPTRDFVLLPTPDDTDETSPGEDDGGEDGPTKPSDDSPPSAGQSHELAGNNGVSSVSSGVGKKPNPPEGAPEGSSDGVRVSSGGPGVSSDNYTLVRDAAGLEMVRLALDESAVVGLDLETTGLDPYQDRTRLLSLACDTIDGGQHAYLVDCFAVDPTPLWDVLAGKELVAHNASFDLGFLRGLGFVPTASVHDTLTLSRLLHAGRFGIDHDLAAVALRELGVTLDKTLQKADWSGPLRPAHLGYAGGDVLHLVPLYGKLRQQIDTAKMADIADVECRCLPALVWMSECGVPFDRAAWHTLADQARADVARLGAELDRLAPQPPGCFAGMGSWNWDSPQQVLEVFALLGITLTDTENETLAEVDHPLAPLVLARRAAGKRAGTYGEEFFKFLRPDGRLATDWKQCGARTGRLSSASPNLQNIPGDTAYRRCFRAPEGRVLVKADYSQIELRIACKVAGEQEMLRAYQSPNADLHTLTAQRITGCEVVTKQQRSMAKPINFGLIYGLGCKSLARKARLEYGVPMTEEDAARYSRAFFEAYPALARWHRRLKAARATETRTLLGRRVAVEAGDSPGKKANYTVQGAGGDGIKLALALVWERRHEVSGAIPVLNVHDELVVECDVGQADAVAAWLKRAMLDAMTPMLDPVPVEVEVKVGRTWAGD